MPAEGTILLHTSQFAAPPQDIRRAQRTDEGLKYDRMRDEIRVRMRDSKFSSQRDASVHLMRTVDPNAVHSNSIMGTFSIQYKNDDYIGEQLMPVAPVGKRSDNFPIYTKRDRLGQVDDTMTSHSDANEIAESRSTGSYALEDFALQDFVPGTTVENEDPGFDEMLDLQEGVLDQLALNREIRIATVLTTGGNYAAGQTTTLAGADQWDSGAGGNPLKALQDGLATCWQGKGQGDFIGFCSIDVWNVMARHPMLVDLFKYTAPGLTKMDAVAREIGLAKILVGGARKDTANPGAAASYSRIWGKHFGILRVARRPSLRNAAFGYTVRFKSHPQAYQWFDPKKGVSGCYFSKVGFSEQHKVVANDTGYLIINAVS